MLGLALRACVPGTRKRAPVVPSHPAEPAAGPSTPSGRIPSPQPGTPGWFPEGGCPLGDRSAHGTRSGGCQEAQGQACPRGCGAPVAASFRPLGRVRARTSPVRSGSGAASPRRARAHESRAYREPGRKSVDAVVASPAGKPLERSARAACYVQVAPAGAEGSPARGVPSLGASKRGECRRRGQAEGAKRRAV